MTETVLQKVAFSQSKSKTFSGCRWTHSMAPEATSFATFLNSARLVLFNLFGDLSKDRRELHLFESSLEPISNWILATGGLETQIVGLLLIELVQSLELLLYWFYPSWFGSGHHFFYLVPHKIILIFFGFEQLRFLDKDRTAISESNSSSVVIFRDFISDCKFVNFVFFFEQSLQLVLLRGIFFPSLSYAYVF